MRMTTPCIVLDVPHQWTAWTKRALVGADDILIVAEPDLANMRNAKNMMSILKTARPNDRPPLYCLNQVGMTKRPEIEVSAFAKTIESQPIATIPFDSRMFGTAANNGQMIAELSANHRTAKTFLQIAQRMTGHADTKQRGPLLAPILRSCGSALAVDQRRTPVNSFGQRPRPAVSPSARTVLAGQQALQRRDILRPPLPAADRPGNALGLRNRPAGLPPAPGWRGWASLASRPWAMRRLFGHRQIFRQR
jgi:hypothetical protein